MSELLRVQDLTIVFNTEGGRLLAVDDISFAVAAGETLAIVGESGSGKSVSVLSVLGLLPRGSVSAAAIEFDGRDLAKADERSLRALRGREIGMIFQDPMTSLNPVLTIGRQLTEMFELHEGLSAGAARDAAVEALALVGVPSPRQRLRAFPHQFSGGMRQRVMIAMAVACRPKLLIADEPTTALDVTIQAQILDLIRRLQKDLGMAMILISHDLGVVAGVADKVAVMYAGRIVESGSVDTVFATPRMPYTEGLLGSVPRFDRDAAVPVSIPGTPPDPLQRTAGCAFAPRCAQTVPECRRIAPDLAAAGPVGHVAACHLVSVPAETAP
ncbi:MAG: ABC transporter ATP-binding protein [Pseudomonadota bacterium]